MGPATVRRGGRTPAPRLPGNRLRVTPSIPAARASSFVSVVLEFLFVIFFQEGLYPLNLLTIRITGHVQLLLCVHTHVYVCVPGCVCVCMCVHMGGVQGCARV